MNGKATRRIPDDRLNPDGRSMRRIERQGEEVIYRALQDYMTATWQYITEFNVQQAVRQAESGASIRNLESALVAWLQETVDAGIRFGQQQMERYVLGVKNGGPIAVDWTLPNNDAAEWAIQYGRELVGQLVKTTTERIQREIAYFVRNSEALEQLIDRVQGGYLYSRDRAEAIAITETTRAFAEGNKAAWRAAGIIKSMEWRTANDELVCPICRPLNGKIVSISGGFQDGIAGPPAHTRCRCWIVPVVRADD